MTPTPVLQPDACALEGTCGICATLTPAARAALADSLIEGPVSTRRAVELWEDAVFEHRSSVTSAAHSLADEPAGEWREYLVITLQIELAKLRALVAAAPADVSPSLALSAPHEGTRALAAALAEKGAGRD